MTTEVQGVQPQEVGDALGKFCQRQRLENPRVWSCEGFGRVLNPSFENQQPRRLSRAVGTEVS